MKANAIIPERVKQRAATNYTVSGSCHISNYSVGSHGYGQIGWHENGVRAGTTTHRAVWELYKGPIPEGKTIDHTCKERRCINVDHMRVLDNFENARRTDGRDWPLGYCAHGHPNKYIHQQPSGKRLCMICRKRWDANYEAKKRRALAQN